MAQKVMTAVVYHNTITPLSSGEKEVLHIMEHHLSLLNTLLEQGFYIHQVHQSTSEHYTVITFILDQKTA